MGAVEETRKAIQDFIAPEIRSLSTQMEALAREQAQLRNELAASEARQQKGLDSVERSVAAAESRTRAEIIASEARVTAAIDKLRSDSHFSFGTRFSSSSWQKSNASSKTYKSKRTKSANTRPTHTWPK
jgi:predicted  nucleic acid-binding Zn-ribbon protein